LAEFRPIWLKFDPSLVFLRAILGEIQPVWKKSANFDVGLAIVGGN
jgi:hypothetical protein